MSETPITRGELASFPRRIIKTGHSWISPDVYVLSTPQGEWVLKDYASCMGLLRNTWGRLVVSREVAVYRRLEGLEGIPRLVARVDPYALLIEYVQAEPLPSKREKQRIGLDFFDRLARVFAAVHERGVAHGDVRRKNILISADRQPYLIDFQSSVLNGPGWFRGRLFKTLARVDDLTVLKIKNRYYPRKTTEAEKQRLEEAPLYLRLGRFIRKRLYHPLSPKILGPKLKGWLGKGKDEGGPPRR